MCKQVLFEPNLFLPKWNTPSSAKQLQNILRILIPDSFKIQTFNFILKLIFYIKENLLSIHQCRGTIKEKKIHTFYR